MDEIKSSHIRAEMDQVKVGFLSWERPNKDHNSLHIKLQNTPSRICELADTRVTTDVTGPCQEPLTKIAIGKRVTNVHLKVKITILSPCANMLHPRTRTQ